MYIIKNAYKSIVRVKVRNLLVFILVFLIAASACVALSVRSSAETAKETTYSSLTITAQISANRQDRKSTRLNSSHRCTSRMPSSA